MIERITPDNPHYHNITVTWADEHRAQITWKDRYEFRFFIIIDIDKANCYKRLVAFFRCNPTPPHKRLITAGTNWRHKARRKDISYVLGITMLNGLIPAWKECNPPPSPAEIERNHRAHEAYLAEEYAATGTI